MKYQRIKNITQLNIEETYDIAMKSPYNNFIANDIIVHNSSIASKVCKQVDPDNFSELCDISALIRPGTLSMGIPEIYSDRKFGRADENNVVWSEKDIPPSIHHILKPTFGLMVYQEEMMQIAEFAAAFSKAETNQLRRLITKLGKLSSDNPTYIKSLKPLYDKFILNASKPLDQNGLGGKMEAQEMWDLMSNFSTYAFNKSHSISYTFLTFQEYWLKAYYRPEFNVALLNNTDKGSKKKGETKISIYATEIMARGMDITSPNVNTSGYNFELIDDKTISWGLSFIKALPDNAILKIVAERKNGAFKDIDDFFNRVTDNGKKMANLNKRAIDALTWSGAFDDFVEQGFQDRFDLHSYIFTTLRKDKSYKGDIYSYKLIVEREEEFCLLSLTEMQSFVEIRKEISASTGKTVNYVYEIEEPGSYFIVAKVEGIENKRTKTQKDYTRITLRDETKSKPFIYVWPWKSPKGYELKKGQIVACKIENDGNFINFVGSFNVLVEA